MQAQVFFKLSLGFEGVDVFGDLGAHGGERAGELADLVLLRTDRVGAIVVAALEPSGGLAQTAHRGDDVAHEQGDAHGQAEHGGDKHEDQGEVAQGELLAQIEVARAPGAQQHVGQVGGVALDVDALVGQTAVGVRVEAAAPQGGQEGGNGVIDVLTGKVNPCGKLTDTIARDIEDYPSTKNFGDADTNIYEEDIYVGYRYFETFAKDKVLYPFGYGLSYTTFDIKSELDVDDSAIGVSAVVTNTGDTAGKEVVQVYVKAPTGKLGQPARKLAAYKKTKKLAPGESETIDLVISKYLFASYDDSGVTGAKSCYVMEAGVYEIYAGFDVRHAPLAGTYEEDFISLTYLQEASAPITPFNRMKALETDNG